MNTKKPIITSATEYATEMEQLKDLAQTIYKKMNFTLNKIDKVENELKEEHRKNCLKKQYEDSKKEYQYTFFQKQELLDEFIDQADFDFEIFDPPDFENRWRSSSDYEVGNYVSDRVPGIKEQVKHILKKAREDIEDLLPAVP